MRSLNGLMNHMLGSLPSPDLSTTAQPLWEIRDQHDRKTLSAKTSSCIVYLAVVFVVVLVTLGHKFELKKVQPSPVDSQYVVTKNTRQLVIAKSN